MVFHWFWSQSQSQSQSLRLSESLVESPRQRLRQGGSGSVSELEVKRQLQQPPDRTVDLVSVHCRAHAWPEV